MAICEISGKGKMYGHNVSFSQHKTRKIEEKRHHQVKSKNTKNPLQSADFLLSRQ